MEKLLVVLFGFVLLLSCSSCITVVTAGGTGRRYNALFGFGDSMTDTGNLCVNGTAAEMELLTFTHPPYGMTYFGKPTCRWCDGRLVIDFLAQALGFPLLPPSKAKGKDFRRGANMAITGGTAMNFSFFQSAGLGNQIWNHGALDTQILWFKSLLPSICGTPQNCKEYMGRSLFVLGAFGGNDYNAQLLFGYTTQQVMPNTPKIVDAITDAVEKLIAVGALHIVVPGILPTGCFPLYLTFFDNTSKSEEYDEYGCLMEYNKLSMYHNSLLKKGLDRIQRKYKWTRIMYADYYTQMYQMVQHPQEFGFGTALEACCGSGGGKYNFDIGARCGMQGSSSCPTPSNHISWDGIHPTEAANKQIAEAWLKGPYCHPPILY